MYTFYSNKINRELLAHVLCVRRHFRICFLFFSFFSVKLCVCVCKTRETEGRQGDETKTRVVRL